MSDAELKDKIFELVEANLDGDNYLRTRAVLRAIDGSAMRRILEVLNGVTAEVENWAKSSEWGTR